jgi:hypothetical protein
VVLRALVESVLAKLFVDTKKWLTAGKSASSCKSKDIADMLRNLPLHIIICCAVAKFTQDEGNAFRPLYHGATSQQSSYHLGVRYVHEYFRIVRRMVSRIAGVEPKASDLRCAALPCALRFLLQPVRWHAPRVPWSCARSHHVHAVLLTPRAPSARTWEGEEFYENGIGGWVLGFPKGGSPDGSLWKPFFKRPTFLILSHMLLWRVTLDVLTYKIGREIMCVRIPTETRAPKTWSRCICFSFLFLGSLAGERSQNLG